MTLEEWMLGARQQIEAAPEPGLRVTNLTRNTILADRLEVAGQSSNRLKGLLGRDGLGSGEGLWIKPCEAIHTFFMRFAIDLVYLDRNNVVRKVRSNVAPWRISACLSAHSVIELPAGIVATTGTQRNDKLEISKLAASTTDSPLAAAESQ